MAHRKKTTSGKGTFSVDRQLVLIGDVRRAPIEVKEGGRVFRPDVAIWVRADDGRVVGTIIGEPGNPAQLLMQVLLQPVPSSGMPAPPTIPGRAVVFNPQLAAELSPILAPFRVDIQVVEPIPEFERILAELFGYLEEANQARGTLKIPDEVLKPLVAASERLWRAKPWEYSYDNPPFAIISEQAGSPAFYASILGARMEVFGVGFYSTLEDYQRTLERGEVTMNTPPWLIDEEAEAAGALEALHQRAYLISFDPKDDMMPSYRDQLARSGWSRRFSVVPDFGAFGGDGPPAELTADEATAVTPALDALITFCERYRDKIADEDFPIEDRVEVPHGQQTMAYRVSVRLDEEQTV